MIKKPHRECPECGGKASMHKSNGEAIIYYCECNKCHLRTRDCTSAHEAAKSWETDDKEYFFLQARLI